MVTTHTEADRPTPARAAPAARAPRALRLVTALVGVVFAVPFVYLALGAGQPATFADLAAEASTQAATLRTLALAACCATSTACIGTATAWFTVRTDLPGRRLLAPILVLPLAVPSFVGALALVATVGSGGLSGRWIGVEFPGLTRGFWAAWLVLTLFTFPYVSLPVAARLAALPPALEESARLLGRGPVVTFFRVVLPQIRPAVLAGSLLVALYTLGEFGAVSVLGVKTLPQLIYTDRLFDPARSRALALLLGGLAMAVVIVERRAAHQLQSTATSTTRRRPLLVGLGAARWPAAGGFALLVAATLGGPVAGMVWWMTRTTRSLEVGGLVRPLLTTTAVAVAAALATAVLTFPLARLSTRWRSRLGEVLGVVVIGGYALPGLVVALAVVSVTLDVPGLGWLNRSVPALLLAYVIHFGAEATRASQVALGAIPANYDDAARLLGAGWWRRLREIELPLILPGVASGTGLVLLSVAKELPITLVAAPVGGTFSSGRFETLATRVWSKQESGLLAQAGLAALALVGVSGLLTWLLVIRPVARRAANADRVVVPGRRPVRRWA